MTLSEGKQIHILNKYKKYKTLTIVEIKQETAHVFIVNFSPSIGLVLRYNLPAIFRNELVLLGAVLQENAPTSHVRWRHQKMFI